MPTLSRCFIRTALIALLAGVGLAVFSARLDGAGILAPTVIHLLVVGWLTQMVFGVAFWLFPKFSTDLPRGREWLGWLTYVTLNVGLLARVVGEPAAGSGQRVPGLLTVSALLQLVAVLAFLVNTWPRLRARA